MSQNPLDPRDARLVDQIQKAYSPPSMSAESQREFDKRLKQGPRAAPQSRNRVYGALLAAAALLVWVQLDTKPIHTEPSVKTDVFTEKSTELYASVLGLEADDLWASNIDTTMLPDSYQQLSSLFLTP